MRTTLLAIGLLLAAGSGAAQDLATPWEQEYTGAQATGANVVGLWKFDGADGLDATGKQPAGQLKNGKLVAEGKFGGALESFPGFPKSDQSHGFVVPHNPRLQLKGAFTLEFWMKAKPEFAESTRAMALDKKYAGNDDFQLFFGPSDAQKQKRLTLSLGYGEDSHGYTSEPGLFPVDEWVHVAATYDGKGEVKFFLNGESLGVVRAPGRGAISPGKLGLSIGDRLGSNYFGFPAYLDEVRITEGVREFGALRIAARWPRSTFVRMEPAPRWATTVTNLRNNPVEGIKLLVETTGEAPVEQTIPSLPAGGTHTVELTFNTALRPDTYEVKVTAIMPGDPPRRVVESFPVVIVSRPLPERMPVVMWGIGGVQQVIEELPRLKRMGFTHCFGGSIDHAKLIDAKEPELVIGTAEIPAVRTMLDTALANDLKILGTTSPSRIEPMLEKYLQVDRKGKPYERPSLSPNAPGMLELFERIGASIAKTYASHPAFEGLCVNSEVRDASQVSFAEWDHAAHRKAFGSDIPDWVTSKYGPNYTTIPDFPKDRVVEDNDPRLEFYRWWWKSGDGWNEAHSAVSRGLHTSPRKDLWTFYDPAVRVPPLWGSGGQVDVLSQWTYTDPDPLRMGLTSDEVLAMAGGRPDARVMKMTQLFWYRSTTAPTGVSPREGESPADWVDTDPNLSFLSIHPMHLREAFWAKIARPFEGIMYHGWGSLVPTDGTHAYKYTHPELQHELTRLTHNVVQPLGPTLRQVPAAKSDIAFLESFTSAVFARRGSWGYAGGWQADLHIAMQHAHLQPEIVYEEHVLRDGLDGYKMIVMADCDVLPRSVVERVLAFQKAGGLVIGDERLCPAIKADIVVPVYLRTKKDTTADKAALLKVAAELREQLRGKYQPLVDVSKPEVIAHRRRAGSTDYLFLINDAREAGDYVGQYGRVKELGLPSSALIRLATPAAAVYDLVAHRELPVRRDERGVTIPVELGPCEGRLLMATEAPIANVAVAGAEKVANGGQWTGRVTVVDASGKPLNAVVPVEIEILDPDGRPAEFSGYYGAAAGTLDLQLDIAANDEPGVWEVRVRELASGLRSSAFFRVASK